jgi:hypothetical protein
MVPDLYWLQPMRASLAGLNIAACYSGGLDTEQMLELRAFPGLLPVRGKS